MDEEIKVANHRIEDIEKNNERMITMKKIFTKQWAKATAVRAIKTVAQTAIATIGVSAVMTDVNWVAVGSASLLAGVLSVLTSIAGLPEVSESGE
ncbi:MAG: holin [Ruminococcus sp.]